MPASQAFAVPCAATNLRGGRRRPALTRARRAAAGVARASPSRCCAAAAGGYDPVEPGVQLPRLAPDALAEEQRWLADAVTSWLDAEWVTSEPVAAHVAIGERVGQIYARQRMEGEDDLAGVLLAVGQELESFDMSDTFVGAFTVANKVADLLLLERAGLRERLPAYQRDPDAPVWSEEKEREVGRRRGEAAGAAAAGDLDPWGMNRQDDGPAIPPPAMDPFERHVFLRDVLDGTTPTRVISGVLAHVVGFKYDPLVGKWLGANVRDEFFQAFGDAPPRDVLVDDDIIAHLESQLEDGDDDGVRAEGLDVVVETLHGMEMTKIKRRSEDDDFRRRCVLAKFFHYFGGF